MNEVGKIISDLSNLDYSLIPYQQTRDLIGQFGQFGFIGLKLHAGNEFIRAIPLKSGETVSLIKDLSYKPQEYNTTYQRASTPNKTMFYAGLIQHGYTPDDFLAMGRLIGLMESVPEMRDKESVLINKNIAYGKWANNKEITLAAIVFDEKYAKENPQTQELFSVFHNGLDEIKELKAHTLTVTNFLAKHFSNEITQFHYDYMISAIFSEICIDRGFDGILYPSVRTIGRGLNVAIKPDVVDKYMELKTAGICCIFKNEENTRVLNKSVSVLQPGQETLNFRLINTPFDFLRQKKLVMAELGINFI